MLIVYRIISKFVLGTSLNVQYTCIYQLLRYYVGKIGACSGFIVSLSISDRYSSLYGGGGQTYVYHHEEDESSFRLVDTARVQKQPHHNKRIKYSQVSVQIT